MRLAVINITGGGLSGGYGNYLANILPRLADDARVESLLCVSPISLRAQDWLPKNKKIQFADCSPYRPFSRKLGRELKKILSSFNSDVIFVPTAIPVSFQNVPVVTMIQNMAPLVSWDWYGFMEMPRLAAQWLETSRAVRRANKVVAISDFVRQFLVEKWRVDPRKIVSIYFGVPPSVASPVRPRCIPSEWRDFVFTAGSIEPYRSLEDIINCAKHFRKYLSHPLKVVLAGSARKNMVGYEMRLKDMAEKAGISSDLCWAGQLSKEEMRWCYEKCSAFLMTSRVEAAPNTVLEAMAYGVVCIAADNAPLPEFFAETALYYDPGNGEMLAARIEEVFSWEEAIRAKVSAGAIERSQKFNWDISAKKTLDLFELVLHS